jgi:hypothetical protein
VAAFGAAEEPHLALISSPELAEPPEGKIVFALGALDLDGGHGFDVGILIIHNRDLILRAGFFGLHLGIISLDLADISAFTALELTPRGDHHRLTFRAEHRYSMRDATRLTLVLGLLETKNFFQMRGCQEKRIPPLQPLENPFFGIEWIIL